MPRDLLHYDLHLLQLWILRTSFVLHPLIPGPFSLLVWDNVVWKPQLQDYENQFLEVKINL